MHGPGAAVTPSFCFGLCSGSGAQRPTRFAFPPRDGAAGCNGVMTERSRAGHKLPVMQPRAGVSLVEVLVAAVLLAVGIGGTLSSLAVTARLREWARDRERVAAEALDRLAWFEARACAQSDTAERVTTAERVALNWGVTDSAGRRVLRFGAASAGRPPQRLVLHSSWRCD